MWSVGAKAIQMYLSTGLVLLQEPGRALLSMKHAPTLPLHAVLNQLQALVQTHGIALKGRSLQIDLSARYALGCTLPSNFTESRSKADGQLQDHVSAQLNIPVSNLVIQADARQQGFVAAMTRGHHKALMDWTHSHGARIDHLRPLWSSVTQARRAQLPSICGVVLLEPDSCTVLASKLMSKSDKMPIRHFGTQTSIDASRLEDQLKVWLSGLQITSQDLVICRFCESAAHQSEPGIASWRGHWEAP